MKNQRVTTQSNGSAVKEEWRRVSLADLRISEVPGQRHPKPAEVAELAASMKATGQTTPAIVRPHPKQKGKFEIAAGARRFVAAQSLGWPELACIVRDLNDDDFELQLLVENMQRQDPDAREEVKIVGRLVERGVKTPAEISARLGKSEHWAARRMKLLSVIPKLLSLWTD